MNAEQRRVAVTCGPIQLTLTAVCWWLGSVTVRTSNLRSTDR